MAIYLHYIFFLIVLILFIFNLLLYIFGRKISKLEENIFVLFDKRFLIIPGLFEISKKYIVKHDRVFSEILRLFKIESTIYDRDTSFTHRIQTHSLIHHEFDFLFKVFNKQPKVIKNYKFIYLRELIIDNSFEISKKIKLYKTIIKNYNTLVKINNIFLIGYLTGREPRKEI